MRDKIVRVAEDDVERLALRENAKRHYKTVKIIDESPDCTLRELIDYIDGECEGANYHNFVGLAGVIATAIKHRHEDGEELATGVLQDIIECGGFIGDAAIVQAELEKPV